MSSLFYNRKMKKNKARIDTAVSDIQERRRALAEWQRRDREEGVRYSRDVDIGDYEDWEKKNAEYTSFSQTVLDMMAKKRISAIPFYKKAHIDRKLFSKLNTDYCYRPNKVTAIKLCFGLDLSLGDAENLLKKAGFALSKSDTFDLAIRYCFEKSITDIDIVNEILSRLEEKTI